MSAMPPEDTQPPATPPRAHQEARRKRLLAGLGGVVAVAALAQTAYYVLYASHFVSTDNAYAAVEIAQVTPSVGGTVSDVPVTDTQTVKAGDVLVRIDPTDAKLALAQAEAEYQRAIRRVKGYVATDGSLAAQITAREADERRAAAQLAAGERHEGRLLARQGGGRQGLAHGAPLSRPNGCRFSRSSTGRP